MDISVDNTSFTNPAACERQVHVFADAPHLIKLIRNNFLDSGFVLPQDKFVRCGPVREFILRSKSDLTTAHKLSEKHINVCGVQRMKVKFATQLLSETTSKSLEYFGRKGLLKDKDCESTSHFIGLADKWFDLFNSRVPYDVKSSRNAYGLALHTQNKVLEDMMYTAKTMRVCGSKSMYAFQRGLIISCASLPRLMEMVQTKYSISYILTYRLNQDVLEHFFACLRQMGVCHTHPSPVAVKHRIRSHLLGKNMALMGNNYNIEGKCNEENISVCSASHCQDQLSTDSENLEESLQRELSLSAMLFLSLPVENSAPECNESDIFDSLEEEVNDFENAVEEEGLRYFGGFVVKKFPQYECLGSQVSKEDTSWIGAVSRGEGKLFKPSCEFFEKLKVMEKAFIAFHGENYLKPGKGVMKGLATDISKIVDLPIEVITYFVRCRTFFRMRVLNRNIISSRKEVSKMKKILK